MIGSLISPLEVNGQEIRDAVAKHMTLDALENVITNLVLSNLAASAKSTVMPIAPTDDTVATAKAVKDFVKQEIDKVIAGMSVSGTITFTNGDAPFPAAVIPGQTWLIAGLTGGAFATLGGVTKVSNGDVLKAQVVSAGGTGASVASNYYVVEGNKSYASVTEMGLVMLSDPASATWTNTATDSATSPAYVSNAIADFIDNRPASFYAVAMTGGATSLTVTAATHGLGTDGVKLSGDLIDTATGTVYPLARPVINPSTGTAVMTTTAPITGATLRLYRLGG